MADYGRVDEDENLIPLKPFAANFADKSVHRQTGLQGSAITSASGSGIPDLGCCQFQDHAEEDDGPERELGERAVPVEVVFQDTTTFGFCSVALARLDRLGISLLCC
ncbi:hypothetical protein ACFX1Q_010600 [Malus domestica]